MVTQELIDYVQGELTRGTEKEAIVRALVASGWPLQDANDALTVVPSTPTQAPASPIAPELSAILVTPQIAESAIAVAVSTENLAPVTLQPAATLGEKAAKIETIYDTAKAEVAELGNDQRKIVADSIKGLEKRKIEEIKKQLGISQST